MSIIKLAKAKPSLENWNILVKELDKETPNKKKFKKLKKILKKWPPWTRIFPAEWFERIALGEKCEWFLLAVDADIGTWAYDKVSATAYSHEMKYAYELERKLELFITSGYASHLLRIRSCYEGGIELFEHMHRVLEIDFMNSISLKILEKIISAPFLPGLEVLKVGQIDMDIPHELWIKLAKKFKNIRILKLKYLSITKEFIEALFHNRKIQPEELYLSTLRIKEDAIDAIVSAKPHRLHKLTLFGPGPTSEGLKILQIDSLSSLKSLTLNVLRTGNSLIDHLLNSSILKNLKYLSLREDNLDDEAIIKLVKSPLAGKLEVLELQYNPFGDNAAKAIANSPYLSNLAELNIREAKVGIEGLKILAESNKLSSIKKINIMHNPGAEEILRLFEKGHNEYHIFT